jgi:putative DNA primase/helicase
MQAATATGPEPELPGSALTEEDLKKVAIRWIDSELALRARLRRVISIEGAALVGREGRSGDYAGIAIPNYWPGEPYVRAWRLRRDHPDMEQTRDGTRRLTRKYLGAPGEGNRVYFVPGTDPQWLGDPSLPLYITEGEFKTMALSRLSWWKAGDTAERPSWVSAGLAGVYSFRGVIAKTVDSEGQRSDVKGVVPDLERIAWPGRKVVIVYDVNVRDNDSVRDARRRLSRVLAERGADVYVVDLPRVEGVNGVDDLLGKWGPEPVFENLAATARPAVARKRRTAGTPVEESEIADSAPLPTDLGNARRFVTQHGQDLRYCRQSRKWLIWDGTRWRPDDRGEIERLAKQTAEAVWEEAKTKPTEEERKRWFGWARTSQSEGKLRAMVSLAESEPGVVVEPHELDADPWILNCRNGTLDLRTAELRPHRREDLCTKQVPVDYDPDAQCPRWRKFLEHVTAVNVDLQAFLQKAVGYTLTGDISEQVVFMLYGTGANGKSTFLEVLRTLLGDYARNADFTTFLASNDSNARSDLARLAGARLVTAVEVERGKRLSEVSIKQITGGDPITARFLYGEFFEYTPQFKAFFAINHKPRIPGGEHAIWRRIRLIPFTVIIPREQRDPKLLEKLKTELSGILAWAVEGCLRWREPGLETPLAVREATEEYREEMDPLTGFFQACCTVDPVSTISAAALYEAYQRYCGQNKDEPVKKNVFGMHLAEMGFHSYCYGKHRVRTWRGLTIQSIDPGSPSGGPDE